MEKNGPILPILAVKYLNQNPYVNWFMSFKYNICLKNYSNISFH